MLQKLVALKFLTLAFLCLATEAQVIQKGGSCPLNWIWQPSNPSVCYYISTERLGYHAADKSCKDKNSSLSSASSSEEHTFISSELIALKRKGCKAKEECANFWIGLRTLSSKSNWTHVDGSQISPATSFWDKGYPSGIGNCGLMHVQDSDQEVIAYWRDENCDEPRPYICKQEIGCHNGFVSSPNQKTCFKFIPEMVTWAEATKRCRALGSQTHLAMIRDAKESNDATGFLRAIFEANSYACGNGSAFLREVWTSGQRRIAESCDEPLVWKPFEGSVASINYTNWDVGQPDCLGNNEKCVSIRPYYGYVWNDVSCSELLCALCQQMP